MKFAFKKPYLGVTQNSARLVRSGVTTRAGVLLLLIWAILEPRNAQTANKDFDFDTQDAENLPSPTPDVDLNDIDAKSYDVKIVQKSTSGHTYLFDDLGENKPSVGKIILLKKDEEPVMAFRVMRTFPEKKQFIGRRVRRYGNHFDLKPGDSVTAYEKTIDLPAAARTGVQVAKDTPPEPPAEAPVEPLVEKVANNETASPQTAPDPASDSLPSQEVAVADTASAGVPPKTAETVSTNAETRTPSSETPKKSEASNKDNAENPASEPKENTKESDPGATPPPPVRPDDNPQGPLGSESAMNYPDDDDPDRTIAATVEESEPFDINRHWISAEGGYFRSKTMLDSSVYYSGFGLRYGITLFRQLFLKGQVPQDSLALEAGAFFYQISKYAVSTDSYTVIPIIGTVRYNLMVSENFGVFFYSGLMDNFVAQALNSNQDALKRLSDSYIAVGGGFIFRLGPNWEARTDFGTDVFGLGLMLRF